MEMDQSNETATANAVTGQATDLQNAATNLQCSWNAKKHASNVPE